MEEEDPWWAGSKTCHQEYPKVRCQVVFWDIVSKPYGTDTFLKLHRLVFQQWLLVVCVLQPSLFVCISAVHKIVAERH